MTERQIFDKLMGYIGNIYGVCALMANMYAESALKANNLQNSGNRALGITDEQYVAEVDSGKRNFIDTRGFGLCQWTSAGRKQALLNFARNLGASIGDCNMQVDFAVYELVTSYKTVFNALQNAKNVDEATRMVMLKYERPANQSEANQKVRVGYAEAFLKKFTTEEVDKMIKIYAYSKAKDGNTKLSTNFKVKEFACKDGSDPIFIAPQLVEILQKVRTHFGKAVTINSAYRTPAYNKKVGGAAYSQHLYGMAADIKVKGVAPNVVADYVETLMPNTGGIGRYAAFTHVDVRKVKTRWNG